MLLCLQGRLRTPRVLCWSQRSIVDHKGAFVATGVDNQVALVAIGVS